MGIFESRHSLDVAYNPDEKSIMTYVSCFYHAFNRPWAPKVTVTSPHDGLNNIPRHTAYASQPMAPQQPIRDPRKDVGGCVKLSFLLHEP